MAVNPANKICILIADSDQESLRTLGKKLRGHGFNVLAASEGRQALAIAQSKRPDAVLAKSSLSQVNGFDLCRAVKNNDDTRAIFFLLLEGAKSGDGKAQADWAGANSFIPASFSPEEIVEHVCGVLGVKAQEENKKEGLRILLVEDNELNQDFISAILQDDGYMIDIADNGSAALETFITRKYDLVLTDINVPVVNGIELTKMIRSKHSKDVPIIAISGHSEKELVDKCLEAGMNSFVTKPFTSAELREHVNKALRKKSERPRPSEIRPSKPKSEKDYCYNNAIEMAKGDRELLKKWVERFRETLKNAIIVVDQAIERNEFPLRQSVFHELINYSGYFGLEDLSSVIHELNAIQKFSNDKERLGNFYRKIKSELEEIRAYYERIGEI